MTENQSLADAAERILVPIDTGDLNAALDMAQRVSEAGAGVKLGLEFYVANGPGAANEVAGWTPLFLDLKFHDIPNTVAGRFGLRSPRPLR